VASSDSIVNRPCMDVDLFSKEEPTQLSSYPAVAKQTIQGPCLQIGSCI
jgi:hypothetical protein